MSNVIHKFLIINGYLAIISRIICDDSNFCVNSITIKNKIILDYNNMVFDGHTIKLYRIIKLLNSYKKKY